MSVFLVPGEDREAKSLALKSTCRTMRQMPWTDPSASRDLVMGFLKEFDWFEKLQIMPPVQSYKEFVVFDMAHHRPYTFSDPSMFDEGCTFDGAVDSPAKLLSNLFL